MRKEISYFDPRCPELEVVDGRNIFGIIANSQEDYDNIMAIITNPEREITNIVEEDLPPAEGYTEEEKDDFLTNVMKGLGL